MAWGLYVDCPVHLHYAGTYWLGGYLYQDRRDAPIAEHMRRGWSEKSDMMPLEIEVVAPQITTAHLWFPGPSIHRRGHLGEAWVDVQIDSMNAGWPPRSVWVRCRVKIDPSVFVDTLPEVHWVD